MAIARTVPAAATTPVAAGGNDERMNDGAQPEPPAFDELSAADRNFSSWACDGTAVGAVYRETWTSNNGGIVERWLRLYNRCLGLHVHAPDLSADGGGRLVRMEIVSLVRRRPETPDAFSTTFTPEALHEFRPPDDTPATSALRLCDRQTRDVLCAGQLRAAWRVQRCRIAGADAPCIWAVDFCVPVISQAAAEAQTGGVSTWEQNETVIAGVFRRILDAAMPAL